GRSVESAAAAICHNRGIRGITRKKNGRHAGNIADARRNPRQVQIWVRDGYRDGIRSERSFGGYDPLYLGAKKRAAVVAGLASQGVSHLGKNARTRLGEAEIPPAGLSKCVLLRRA